MRRRGRDRIERGGCERGGGGVGAVLRLQCCNSLARRDCVAGAATRSTFCKTFKLLHLSTLFLLISTISCAPFLVLVACCRACPCTVSRPLDPHLPALRTPTSPAHALTIARLFNTAYAYTSPPPRPDILKSPSLHCIRVSVQRNDTTFQPISPAAADAPASTSSTPSQQSRAPESETG